MKVEKKQWDSDFFNLRIGYVEIESLEDSRELATQREQLADEYDLIYIFDANRVGFDGEDAKLVDEKILYTKICENRDKYEEVMLYVPEEPNDSLYKLALVSGEFSRFRLDERLPKGSYERMYHRWIENACPFPGTNKQIFVYSPDGIAQGMITVDYKGNKAQIGLVAIDSEYQHQGVGTKIMSTLEYVLYREGIWNIDVVTQSANKVACSWYEKNGFTIKSVTNIYHWWLKNK